VFDPQDTRFDVFIFDSVLRRLILSFILDLCEDVSLDGGSLNYYTELRCAKQHRLLCAYAWLQKMCHNAELDKT
jgi:hypothetical protein